MWPYLLLFSSLYMLLGRCRFLSPGHAQDKAEKFGQEWSHGTAWPKLWPGNQGSGTAEHAVICQPPT